MIEHDLAQAIEPVFRKHHYVPWYPQYRDALVMLTPALPKFYPVERSLWKRIKDTYKIAKTEWTRKFTIVPVRAP